MRRVAPPAVPLDAWVSELCASSIDIGEASTVAVTKGGGISGVIMIAVGLGGGALFIAVLVWRTRRYLRQRRAVLEPRMSMGSSTASS
eukprot:NODE_22169_length_719_cov_5.405405.p1 GENE.NODE_22169_length_719_cov_5.405405~~NODE_22169_length_719_cov_5.405405.p1  ORF type:complete len:97 (-),score=25.11 NODE_22169_length_719_cov_5.405405:429-692(-)